VYVPVYVVLDQIALPIECSRQVGIPGKGRKGGGDVEMRVDSFAEMAVVTVVCGGAACEKERRQGRGSKGPEFPADSLCWIHRFIPPSLVTPVLFL
jgi:hypothetical protein